MAGKPKFAKNSATVESSDGEITFIAARSVKNLNGFTYDVRSLQAQDTTGEYHTLTNSVLDVSIPLMLDHKAESKDKIGRIDSAKIVEVDGIDHVEMHAKFFKGDEAQAVRQRILDGELTDVSITTDWGDGYTDEDDYEQLKNAHIIEVSVVYAGAEPKAKILASNSVDTQGDEEEEQPEVEEVAIVEDEVTTVTEEPEEAETTEEEETEEEEAEEETNDIPEEEEEMAKQPTEVQEVAENFATKAQVLNSLANLAKSGAIRGMNKNQVKEAVENAIVITDGGEGTYTVPDAVWTEILGAERETDILDTFKTTPVRRKTILAEERSETDLARAGKYTKDELKVIQDLTLVPTKFDTQFLYKLQKISYEDLQEDFGNVLYNFIKNELPQKISEEEERDFIVGDGRLTSDDRHISSIVSLDAAAADSANVSVYNYNGTADASAIAAVMNGIAKLGEDGTRYAVMNLATLTAFRQAGLATPSGLPFSVDVVAGALGVSRIFTREYVAANTVYVWTGNLVERLTGPVDEIEQYDIDYNNRKIEALRRVGGGATGLYSAVKVTLPAPVSA